MSKYPILFEQNETVFKTHGIGVLSDAVQCDVTEEINGVFELNMLYPSSGKHFKELKNNRIIFADASKELGHQPFRICRVTKTLTGLIQVHACHISYDLGGIQLPPFEVDGITEAFQKLKQYSTTENKFTFQTSLEAEGNINLETPTSVRAYLMGAKNSVLQTYGGEFTFDRFNVSLASTRGTEKGFRIRYGVNMVDLNQEESIENTFTGIYPYYKDANQYTDMNVTYDTFNRPEIDVSDLPGKILYAEGSFDHQKIASVNLSKYFDDEAPLSTDEVTEKAREYMRENKIGVPKVSLDVRFESLRKSPEYANVAFMEDAFLGDLIQVDFVKLGVSSEGRINSIIYDSLKHKNKRVSIGDPKSNITDTFYTMENTVKESETNIAGLSKSVAKVEVLSNQNSAKVEILVETNKAGENVVKGSVLVEAINGQSTATIKADKVNLTGYVTVNSLKAGGSTVIDGSRIQTGQIVSKNFVDEYMTLYRAYEDDLNPNEYYFKIDTASSEYYIFTITKVVPVGGYVRFNKQLLRVDTFDAEGNAIETLFARKSTSSSGIALDLDVSAFFSESGTKIDLDNGEIISNQFAIKGDRAFFGGSLDVGSGRLGAFHLDGTKLISITSFEGSFNVVAVGREYLSYISRHGQGYVSFNAGDLYDDDIESIQFVSIENASSSLKVTPSDANLFGSWKATPYTNINGDPSEIVTKQDLISLGLIPR
jgi:phage minor structural protein